MRARKYEQGKSLIGFAVFILAGSVLSQNTIDGFLYRPEYYDDGNVKTEIRAEKVTPDGDGVRAVGVTARCYTVEGATDIVITAEECMYNKKDMYMTSGSRVRLERDGITISGKGMKWDGKKQKIELLSNVRVELTRELRTKPGGGNRR